VDFACDENGSIRIRLDLKTKAMTYYTYHDAFVSDSDWIMFSNNMYNDTSLDTEVIRYSDHSLREIINITKNGSFVSYAPRTILKTI
jgi:hypothetical protein